MTKQEVENIMAKSPDALTYSDIQLLNHVQTMLEVMPDYLDTLEQEVYPVYQEVLEAGEVVIKYIMVRRE